MLNIIKKIRGEKKPATIPIENIDYDCGNNNLNSAIKYYLGHHYDESECLEHLLHIMEPLDDYHIRENKEILPIIEDLLCEAEWKNTWQYKSHNMEVLYSKFYTMDRDINMAKNLMEQWKDPHDYTVLGIAHGYDSAITQEIIDNQPDLAIKHDKYKDIISSGDYTPLDAVKMFEENWDYIYNLGVTYKALFYMINLSQNHTITPCMNADIRSFGLKMRPTYEQVRVAWEKKVRG